MAAVIQVVRERRRRTKRTSVTGEGGLFGERHTHLRRQQSMAKLGVGMAVLRFVNKLKKAVELRRRNIDFDAVAKLQERQTGCLRLWSYLIFLLVFYVILVLQKDAGGWIPVRRAKTARVLSGF